MVVFIGIFADPQLFAGCLPSPLPRPAQASISPTFKTFYKWAQKAMGTWKKYKEAHIYRGLLQAP